MPCTTNAPTHARPSLPVNQNPNPGPVKPSHNGTTPYCCYSSWCCSFSVSFLTGLCLLEKIQCFPTLHVGRTFEFYPTFAYSENLVILRVMLCSLFQLIFIADVIKLNGALSMFCRYKLVVPYLDVSKTT